MAAASQTVRQIAIDQPSAIDVFDRMGIEYCCKGWKTLQDACSEIAISVKDVVRALDQAAAGDQGRQFEIRKQNARIFDSARPSEPTWTSQRRDSQFCKELRQPWQIGIVPGTQNWQ